jgi:hypothetical protein
VVAVGPPTWAPDSQWLVVTWSAAGQLWFVHAIGPPRIIAESRVAAKLGSGAHAGPLRLDGWCCPR